MTFYIHAYTNQVYPKPVRRSRSKRLRQVISSGGLTDSPAATTLSDDADANMPTTVLTYSQSSYSATLRHAFFDLHQSIPVEGETWRGFGEWWVKRNQQFIASAFNVMNYSWIGEHNDIVYSRYVDDAGNKGNWETYTFVANQSFHYTQYVAASGNSSNSGQTPSLAVSSLFTAMQNAYSNITSGQEAVIYVKESEIHSITQSAVSGSEIPRRFNLKRWGNSGSRPQINFTTDLFNNGNREAYTLDDINVSGDGTGILADCNRLVNPSYTRDPYNVIIRNCNTSAVNRELYLADVSESVSNIDDPRHTFIAFENCHFYNSYNYHIYAASHPQKFLLRNVTIGPTNSFHTSFRMWGPRDFYFENLRYDASDGTRLRIISRPDYGTSGQTQNGSFLNCSMSGTNSNLYSYAFEPETTQAGVCYLSSVRFVNQDMYNAGLVVRNQDFGANTETAIECKRLEFWNCALVNAGIDIQSSATLNAVNDNIVLKNCAVSKTYAGGASIVSLGGSSNNYANNSITLIDNVGLYSVAGNNEPRSAIQREFGTALTLGSSIYFSNHNHVGKVDSQTINWANNGSTDLTTWRTLTGQDTSSTVTFNTTMNFTNTGSTDAFAVNFRLASAAGPLYQTGYPRAYSIDKDNHIRSVTAPCAGPYEYGSTTTPDQPS
jgi:hypothetical protein